jgi:hypothetical protein
MLLNHLSRNVKKAKGFFKKKEYKVKSGTNYQKRVYHMKVVTGKVKL